MKRRTLPAVRACAVFRKRAGRATLRWCRLQASARLRRRRTCPTGRL